MKEKIIQSIKRRISKEISNQNPLKYLIDLDVESYIDNVIASVYLYTRPKRGSDQTVCYLTEVISAIGHGIRGKLKMKRDSAIAAKTGAFMLYSFEALGIIQVNLGKGAVHNAYIVNVLDDDKLRKLWTELEPSQIEKLPSLEPYAPWATVKHESGARMVKTNCKEVLDNLRLDSHPMVFECINRAQAVGWNINKSVFEVQKWALLKKTEAFSDIWTQQNPQARATKLREAKNIFGMAEKFLGQTFYHIYFYDFRGRRYPGTAYLHEQGTDVARGLLLRADKAPIGEEGFFWLMVSIASNWGGDAGRPDGLKTDKIPLQDRFYWAIENEEMLLSFSSDPKKNRGWMEADKPWQFLAACMELDALRKWQWENRDGAFGEIFENYAFESGLECYIDG